MILLDKLPPRVKIYDFRGVIVDTSGNLMDNAILRISTDIDERKVTPLFLCTESKSDVKSIARKHSLAKFLTDDTILSLGNQSHTNKPFNLKSDHLVALSYALIERGVKAIDAYTTSSISNAGAANEANREFQQVRVRKSGSPTFSVIYLFNTQYAKSEPIRKDNQSRRALYVPINDIMNAN